MHGWPAKLPRRCSLFLSELCFLFPFSFLFYNAFGLVSFSSYKNQCLAEKVYLNLFAKPTPCHPFNSFLQQPGVIVCMVVILFATPGSSPLKKNDHIEEIKSQIFY